MNTFDEYLAKYDKAEREWFWATFRFQVQIIFMILGILANIYLIYLLLK